MLEELDSYDWDCAFGYAGADNVSPVLDWTGDASGFTREDVVEIVAMDDGQSDGENWIGLFRLRDGRYAFLSAGCDFTGWDCQASGHAIVGPDAATMIRLGLGQHDRERLGLSLEGS